MFYLQTQVFILSRYAFYHKDSSAIFYLQIMKTVYLSLFILLVAVCFVHTKSGRKKKCKGTDNPETCIKTCKVKNCQEKCQGKADPERCMKRCQCKGECEGKSKKCRKECMKGKVKS